MQIPRTEKYILDLVSAGLDANKSRVELVTITLARHLSKENPQFAARLNEIIDQFTVSRGASVRGNSQPLPIDTDSQMEMAEIIPPDSEGAMPILNSAIQNKVSDFLEERANVSRLLAMGIRPSNSILLHGRPGSGKTMLAHSIAHQLNKDLVKLDLSTTISSYLGKTGANIKKVLNYAKNTGSVLLLDEFDAIAKRRDDVSDLGEIKRVVNVLLMELENWPVASVLIATTNHPELLDKAIWRRFDHIIELGGLNINNRVKLIEDEFNGFLSKDHADKKLLMLSAEILGEHSPAELYKFTANIKRRIALKETPFKIAVLEELVLTVDSAIYKNLFIDAAIQVLGEEYSVRKISDLTNIPHTTVQYILKKPLKEKISKSTKSTKK